MAVLDKGNSIGKRVVALEIYWHQLTSRLYLEVLVGLAWLPRWRSCSNGCRHLSLFSAFSGQPLVPFWPL
ncbi:MAG: hypothetical protein ACYC2T_08450 [Bacillota bacterium]